VAEGIEQVAQQEQLLRLQCLLGQGFLWAAPLVARDAEELLSAPAPVAVPVP
jgi:EAL domain-containing protein (putative c-di-GMP-specific phosphodiesterase class I)